MNDQTVDLMQPWAFLKQTVGIFGVPKRPFVFATTPKSLRDCNWFFLVPGLLLNRSVGRFHGFPWKGPKKPGIPYSPLGLWSSGDERMKETRCFIPFLWDLIQSQLDANWLCCKFLRFLLNTNLRSLWKLPNRSTGQPGQRPGGLSSWIIWVGLWIFCQ